MAAHAYCNVFMHDTMNSSRLLWSFRKHEEVDRVMRRDVRHFLTIPDSPNAPATANVELFPDMRPHSAISVVRARTEFDRFTCCHVRNGLDRMDATLYWVYAIRFVATAVLPAANLPTAGVGQRRRWIGDGDAPLVGVFLQCTDVGQYSLGLITDGTVHNPLVHALCHEFVRLVCGGRPFTETFAKLPICARVRRVSLGVWWTPQTARVVPCVPLPCIKIILKDRMPSPALAVSEDVPVFQGYHQLRLFLARPSDSSLQGTLQYLVPHDPADAEDERVPTTPTTSVASALAPRGTQSPTKRNTTQPYLDPEVDPETDPTASGVAYFAVNGKYRAVAHILFTDVAVGQTGEHLIGVELTVQEAYKPFVPVVCGRLSPFLAVSSADA